MSSAAPSSTVSLGSILEFFLKMSAGVCEYFMIVKLAIVDFHTCSEFNNKLLQRPVWTFKLSHDNSLHEQNSTLTLLSLKSLSETLCFDCCRTGLSSRGHPEICWAESCRLYTCTDFTEQKLRQGEYNCQDAIKQCQ